MCRLIEFLASQSGISKTQIIIIAILVLVLGILFPNIVIALFTVVIAAAMVLGLHEVYPRRPEIEKLEPTISNKMTFTITKSNKSELTGRVNLGFKNLSKRITIRPKVQIRIPIELVPLNYLQSHEARGEYDRLEVDCKDPASWHVPCDPQSKEPTRGPLRSSVAGFAHYSFSDFPDAGYVDMYFEPPFVASEQDFRFWLRILLEGDGTEKTILMIVSVPYFQREVSKVFSYTLPTDQ
jgi:hypothetical protein